MNQNSPHSSWKAIAARLIVAGASIGGLSALVGCDQSDSTQFASDAISAKSPFDQPDLAAAMESGKDLAGSKLASNHNETFLLG